MNFVSLPLVGACRIDIEPKADERGFFARAWCSEEFASHGLPATLAQASLSYNVRAGTFRGLHFSWPPAAEGKIVRCIAGRVHDVLLDLRASSPTFLRHVDVVLDSVERSAVYVPPGVAHGFQTLVDGCEILYMMSEAYRPELQDGVRFDDPAFGIALPLPVTSMAERDWSYPLFDVARHEAGLARTWRT